MPRSETSRVRLKVLPYIEGIGVDLGYGGDSITRQTINVDLPEPYARLGDDPLHIGADCRKLPWFADSSLDYVYSSHLLEDFEDIPAVLAEWTRVIKAGGRLILCMPNEQLYQDHCKSIDEDPNEHHTHEDMSLDYMLPLLDGWNILLAEQLKPYSFVIVAERPKE
jgi:predicted SAM-dependent methyltransferase